jgi:type II secretion system protein H
MGRLRLQTSDQAGFTLIELVMVMAIGSVLASIAAFSFANWRSTAEHQGSAQEIVSQLRNAAELAISEGRTHCVDLDASARSYSVWRYACSTSTGTKVSGTLKTQSSRVTFTPTLTSPTPAPACPAGHSCLYFYPRGTAIPGTITVASSSRNKIYTIHVEGLTARVYM